MMLGMQLRSVKDTQLLTEGDIFVFIIRCCRATPICNYDYTP